jgi:hypothetical protein
MRLRESSAKSWKNSGNSVPEYVYYVSHYIENFGEFVAESLHFHHSRSASSGALPPARMPRALSAALSRGEPIATRSSTSRTVARSMSPPAATSPSPKRFFFGLGKPMVAGGREGFGFGAGDKPAPPPSGACMGAVSTSIAAAATPGSFTHAWRRLQAVGTSLLQQLLEGNTRCLGQKFTFQTKFNPLQSRIRYDGRRCWRGYRRPYRRCSCSCSDHQAFACSCIRGRERKFVAILTEARACHQEALLSAARESLSAAPWAQPPKTECEHASRRLAAKTRSRPIFRAITLASSIP